MSVVEPHVTDWTTHLKNRVIRSASLRLNHALWLARSLPARRTVRKVAGFDVSTIPTWTTTPELVALYELARQVPAGGHALEIGSYLGASTCYLAAGLAARGGRLYCVDTWGNENMPEGPRDTLAEFERNVAAVRERLVVVRKRSVDLLEADVALPLSLVFIDGDHEYEAVKGDWLKVSPWLPVGGVIAFHDSSAFVGVRRTIGEALATGTWQIGGVLNNLFWIVKQ